MTHLQQQHLNVSVKTIISHLLMNEPFATAAAAIAC
jgi:hypothetical protein